MTKAETISFIKKIKAYYPIFKLEEEGVDEWASRLKPYSKDDILRKFEEHLRGEYALEPPKLHFLTKFLKTEEEKERFSNDYLIRCNLCGQEMYLSEYDNSHYQKCLLIKSLMIILKDKKVSYEELEVYPIEKLEAIWSKYVPLKKEI